jgi:hypothetical protein
MFSLWNFVLTVNIELAGQVSESVSESLLFNAKWTIFCSIMERTRYIQWDDNDVHFVLDQHV